ncbi:MAG: VWA domain-containing protein [Chloroflexota bacterium]|nr:MAG: VWA domain-containing protein [Chloroflexota bacterium]
MTFETPTALALGLAIPAIIALWILRPRRPRLRVPSLLLWPGSPAERQSARPWQRLRNHPLLWLQLAAAALLALAAARPFAPADAAGRHLVVFLDSSGSMQARDVAPNRFEAARRALLDLARGLGPDQEMTVIRLDEEPRVLVAGAHSINQVEAAVSGEAPSYGPADAGAAVALAAGLSQGPAEWIMVGDGGLAFPDDARRPAGTSFRFVAVGQSAANVSITGLIARTGPDGLSLQAGLRNLGPDPVSGHLQLVAEGELIGAREWRLEPERETYVIWGHLAAGPRWYEVRLSGVPAAANALEHDDRAWIAISVPDEPTALLISPGSTFLERVLSVHGSLRPFRAAPADWSGLVAQNVVYPMVVFDRFWPETPPASSLLLVGPPTGEEFRPGEIWPRTSHPLLRHVDWSEVQVATARKLPLDGDWETVVDSDGGPLLAVRTVAGRRQAAFAFELSQSDLPLRPAFPILMANLLDWLVARPEAAPQTIPVGTSASVEASPLAERIWVETLDGQHYDLAPPWPPRSFRPPAPGLYRVVQEGQEIRQEAALVADGYHPLEADLSPRTPDLAAADGEPPAPARGALSFWPWLAAAIVLLSLVEWWMDARGE